MDLGSMLLMAQEVAEGDSGSGARLLGMLIGLVLAAITVAGTWRIYTKAGQPGWACLIPIYNLVVMLRIVGAPLWWVVFFFVPVLNFCASVMVAWRLARAFGQGVLGFLALAFLPFLMMPALGFGSAAYQRP